MQSPFTHVGAALASSTELARMLADVHQRAIRPAVTAHEVAMRSTAVARSLAEFSAEIGCMKPVMQVPRHG